jgi:hypothetical protein
VVSEEVVVVGPLTWTFTDWVPVTDVVRSVVIVLVMEVVVVTGLSVVVCAVAVETAGAKPTTIARAGAARRGMEGKVMPRHGVRITPSG